MQISSTFETLIFTILKQKTTRYLLLFFLLLSFKGFFAQDFSLKLSSKKKNEVSILNKIDFQKKHKDSSSIHTEVQKISNYLKSIGYFAHTIDSVKKNEKDYITYFSLNHKIKEAIIKTGFNIESIPKELKKENNIITIPIENLKSTLNKISLNLDKKGKSFSKVKLKNILIKGNTLFADLEIYQSKKRVINRVIIKGYENFPKSFLKNHFNIKSNTIFNQKKIREISKASKSLKFVTEIKPPEVLFTKDSTLLYVYLKKHQNNSFDGIINFASKEDGSILLIGNIDIKLNNILNTGEKFELFWNSIAEERQEFKLTTETPYIFNSKFSTQFSFSIYKQDSTFLNTKFSSKLFYKINSKTNLGITYSSESSENLQNIIDNNIETFNNRFLGLRLEYIIPTNDSFFNDKINLEINPSLGIRKTIQNQLNQFKIIASSSYLWNINARHNIFIKNKTGYLNSDNYITNELFRIGGANSLRGFNEQSIFTNSFCYLNLEYRYLVTKKSYLYTITDIGKVKNNLNTQNLLGIGLGYLFTTNKSQINLNTVIGKNSSQPFDFKNSKITINWKNFF